MTRTTSLILLAAMTAGLAVSEDLKFGKIRLMNNEGREEKVDLVFSEADSALVVQKKKTVFTQIPFSSIEAVAYGRSKHHRLNEGGEWLTFPFPNPVGGVIGGLVMLTKGKKHWLYVDYLDPDNVPRELVFRLDKSVVEKVLLAVRTRADIGVEMLPDDDEQKEQDAQDKDEQNDETK